MESRGRNHTFSLLALLIAVAFLVVPGAGAEEASLKQVPTKSPGTVPATPAAKASPSKSSPEADKGHQVLPFETRTIDGNAVKMPASYKGKLVLLDFWATWCGPCKAELPNLTAVYEKYHDKGLEILGVSLDNPGVGPKLIAFTKEHNMTWPQVYDGKAWKTPIAKQYGIQAIPRAFLVDGDTGEILTAPTELRGAKLLPTIEKALAKKAGK